MNKRRVVYMGTPEFAVPSLEALVDAGHELLAVFTQPDKPAGRGKKLASPPVKVRAEELGLPVYQPPKLNNPEVIAHLQKLAPEVIVVAAYAQLLPQSILSLPRYGCKNIHASLLPKYRGGAPVHWAIVRGETQTGISIMHMDKGLDTGDIVLRKSIAIEPEDTCGDITSRLAKLGAEMILCCLEQEDMGESLRRPQPHELSTFARNVKKQDGHVDWQKSSREIHDLVRGFNPWPGACAFLNGLRVGIVTTSLTDIPLNLPPGAMQLSDGNLCVGTGEGTLVIKVIVPAGKKKMSGEDFFRGYVARRAPQERQFN